MKIALPIFKTRMLVFPVYRRKKATATTIQLNLMSITLGSLWREAILKVAVPKFLVGFDWDESFCPVLTGTRKKRLFIINGVYNNRNLMNKDSLRLEGVDRYLVILTT